MRTGIFRIKGLSHRTAVDGYDEFRGSLAERARERIEEAKRRPRQLTTEGKKDLFVTWEEYAAKGNFISIIHSLDIFILENYVIDEETKLQVEKSIKQGITNSRLFSTKGVIFDSTCSEIGFIDKSYVEDMKLVVNTKWLSDALKRFALDSVCLDAVLEIICDRIEKHSEDLLLYAINLIKQTAIDISFKKIAAWKAVSEIVRIAVIDALRDMGAFGELKDLLGEERFSLSDPVRAAARAALVGQTLD